MSARDGGYTILEALVAFTILAVVLVALYGVSGSSLRLIGEGARTREAAELAQSKLDEIAALRDPLPPVSNGSFPNSDIAWRIEARDVKSGAPRERPFRLQQVRVVLSWGTRTFEVQTRHLGIETPP